MNKSGAWYSYEGERLGQGRENAKQFMKEHQDIAQVIEQKIRVASNLTTAVPVPTTEDQQKEAAEEQELFEINE